MILTFPIPGIVAVVSLAVFGLSGDRIQLIPGLPLVQVHLELLFAERFS